MNDTLQFIKTRRTCRRFKPEQITDEELNAVLEAGTYAPSGMGAQSPILIAIQDDEVKSKLAEINLQTWKNHKGRKDPFYGAPTVIAILADPNVCHTYKLDGMACAVNMLIAAESLGLGAGIVSRADNEFKSEYGKELLASLGIPEHFVGVEHVLLGYKEGATPTPPVRKENYIYKL